MPGCSARGGREARNANVITRAVGVAEDLEVDSSTGEAAPGDLFLLASDGLTRLVDDDEILEQLSRGDARRRRRHADRTGPRRAALRTMFRSSSPKLS